jgi:branched-chain amino acid transport system permease protein
MTTLESTELLIVDEDFEPEHEDTFRPSAAGWAARGLVLGVVAFVVLLLPYLILDKGDFDAMCTAVVFAIFGISLNVLLGYTGTISLGHQAFIGIGAFSSAYVVSVWHQPFLLGVAGAGLVGAVQALLLGGLALRVTGLYFALITLSYGLFAQDTLFGVKTITGGAAGREAPLPTGPSHFIPYYYICLAFLAGVLWVDWRMMKTKGGRALLALRENSRVAATLGVNVKMYLLFGFMVSGVFAGIGGALYAHLNGFVDPTRFDINFAFLLVLMTVAGGLRNRSGIVIASAITALMDLFIRKIPGAQHRLQDLEHTIPWVAILVGAALLGVGVYRKRYVMVGIGAALAVLGIAILSPAEVPLIEPQIRQWPALTAGTFRLLLLPLIVMVTLITAPGGLGQQIRPIQHWLAGHRFDPHVGHVEEVEVSDVRA